MQTANKDCIKTVKLTKIEDEIFPNNAKCDPKIWRSLLSLLQPGAVYFYRGW